MTGAPGLDNRLQLVPVDQFSDRRHTVTDQLRDLVQRHSRVR